LKGQIMATVFKAGEKVQLGKIEVVFVALTKHGKSATIIYKGEHRTVDTKELKKLPTVKPTPFPEPERWQKHVGNATGCAVAAGSHYFETWGSDQADTAIIAHNAEIDRLMREIRRLEALVHK
jgi:hypothetical protein